MNILVTGAAGLYGIHLIDQLVKEKDVKHVIGFDNFSRDFLVKDPFIQSKELKKKFKFYKRNYRTLALKELNSFDLDFVVHLAAFISIPESMRMEKAYFMNNEFGTFQLIHLLHRTEKKPHFIFASSPEVYGSAIYAPMDEKHPMLPRSVYAVTKLASEKHCMAMYEWYGYPITIIRNFNTFGPNQNIFGNAAVVSNFIARSVQGKNIVIHGDGLQTRDFQFINDAVRAYVLTIMNSKKMIGKIVNIGTGKQTRIKDLAEIIVKLTKVKSKIKYVPTRGADLRSLEANYNEIQALVGWKPQYSLETGLKKTIDWFKQNI